MANKSWRYFTTNDGHKVKIDSEDFKRVSERSWRVTEGTTGRARVVTSVRGPEGVRSITLGKFLKRPPKGKQVYPRRFNDGLDYRKENLIICTLQERQRLLPKKRSNTSSKFRGVSFSRSEHAWRAGIEVDGKSINLGNFDTQEEAAYAYNVAARKHFGDMAYQNRVSKEFRRRRDEKKPRAKRASARK
jgi:AP2-like factor (euAP2 lineage)